MKSAQVLLTGALMLWVNLAFATGLKIPVDSAGDTRPLPLGRSSSFVNREARVVTDESPFAGPVGAIPRARVLDRPRYSGAGRRLALDDVTGSERQALAGPWAGIVDGAGPAVNGRRLGLPGLAGPRAQADLKYDAFVYGSRSQSGSRSFVHVLNNTTPGTASAGWHREGVGVEHRGSQWRWAAELSTGSSDRTGMSLATRWKPSGPWALSARYQSISSNTPLAAWQAGRWASERVLDTEYLWNARRKFQGSVTQLAFSDGSERIVQVASWHEKWIDEPLRKLATSLGLRSAHNVGSGVNSLGGEQGQAVTFEMRSEDHDLGRWLRRSQRRWFAYAGVTQQADGSEAAVHGSNYEETLELRKGVSVRYLVGREVRPVEGLTLRRNYATLALLWQY